MRRVLVLTAMLLAMPAASAMAAEWAGMATVSATLGAKANRLCVGEGFTTDARLGCPSYAPSLTTAGDVSISGNVSANKFIGDGSALTGLAATGDRITSDTSNIIVNGPTNYISITQGGSGTGWFDPTRGLVTLGVSATGPVSGTRGYFSGNVGIGTSMPSTSLHVSGTVSTEANGGFTLRTWDRTTTAGGFYGGPSNGVTLRSVYEDLRLTAQAARSMIFSTSNAERVRITANGLIGIGTAAPSSSLHVSGTVRIADGGEACDADRAGAIRYTSASILQFCRGSGWQDLADAAGGSAAEGDRITSGTLAMVANSATSYISLSTSGTDWGYLSGGLSYLPFIHAPTVSSTLVSATNISGTLIQVGGGNGAACDASRKGAIRYSDTSSTVEYCNSTAWVSMGPSATVIPAFSVTRNSNQTVTTGAITKITWQNIEFDTNNNFELGNNRYRPTVPGYYIFNTSAYCPDSTGYCRVGLYKNGSAIQSTLSRASSGTAASVSAIAYMDGSTDFMEVFITNSGGTAVSGGAGVVYTKFTGALISMAGGGGGGGATNLNELQDVNTGGASVGDILAFDGSQWVVSDSATSAISSLTDVTLTNLAGRDYLRYDSVAGKWVNISESTVMSTTTMVAGWPDAITCSNGTATRILIMRHMTATQAQYADATDAVATRYTVTFNVAGQTYNSHESYGGYDCVTGAMSIADLYAAGKAFNFIGSANVAASAEGDRITSGTLAMVANSATSYVSLTSGGTTWGYFGQGASYLPTITANRVSSTNISATHLQLHSPTTVLACGAGLEGAMRYTSGTMQVCDGLNWGNIGIGVPTGTITAFAASSCPSGWTEYTPARGRFLRGIDTLAAGIDPSGTRAAGNVQDDALQNMTGTVSGAQDNLAGTGVFSNGTSVANASRPTNGTASSRPVHFDASNVARTSNETRPKNVAVTFCVYSGFQSAPGQTVLTTLASLTDVSANGATTGQALIFDGASWIASTTTPASMAEGDRLVSDTHMVVVNDPSGYISLSTSGIDWGYLGSAASYLPNLRSNSISATLVSATNISATYVHLNSATTPLTCGAGLEGAMRYTSGTMQVCDGSAWGNIGIGVPTGTIAAFAASSCPSGWTEYTASRGRFLRGIDNGAGNDPSGTRAPGNAQGDALQKITGQIRFASNRTNVAANPGVGAFQGVAGSETGMVASGGGGGTDRPANVDFDASRVARTADETRPKNVAVTFCVYSGFQSAPGQTVLTTLASLTDVSVGGVTTGQVLAFDGASWVPSDSEVGGSTAEGDRIVSGSSNIIATLDRSLTFTTAGSQQMVVGENGRVGIGTSSPNVTLEVSGSIRATGGLVTGTQGLDRVELGMSGGTPRILFEDDAHASVAQIDKLGANLRILPGSTGNVSILLTGSEELARFASTGNVGISTSNPLAKLDVVGTISASDAIQVGTSSLTCGSGIAGAMRYTSGTMQVCNGTSWGNIGIGVPTGTIAAFAASSCPSGWTEYTASRGRFLRGIDNGAGNDPDGTRAAGHAQGDAAPNITGSFNGGTARPMVLSAGGAFSTIGALIAAGADAGSANRYQGANFSASDSNAKYGAADEIRPKNVAVTFCAYSGFQSAPGQTILTTLASLTDVSVGGASNGQVLTYNAGSWVAATSAASGTGAIQFKSSSGGLGGDTTNLYWDNAVKRLGVGTSGPDYSLHVEGNVGLTNAGFGATLYLVNVATWNGNFFLCYTSTATNQYRVTKNTTCNASDRRLKKNVVDSRYGLEAIMKLRPIEFDWKDPKSGTGHQVGLIAQEVNEVIPEVVSKPTQRNEMFSLKYESLVVPLIKAVQELKSMLDTALAEVRNLAVRVLGVEQAQVGLAEELKQVRAENTTLRVSVRKLEADNTLLREGLEGIRRDIKRVEGQKAANDNVAPGAGVRKLAGQ